MVDKLELRNNFFSTSLAREVQAAMILLFHDLMIPNFTIIYHHKHIKHEPTLETNKLKLAKYYVLVDMEKMCVFIHIFTYIEKGVKCRGKNILTQSV